MPFPDDPGVVACAVQDPRKTVFVGPQIDIVDKDAVGERVFAGEKARAVGRADRSA